MAGEIQAPYWKRQEEHRGNIGTLLEAVGCGRGNIGTLLEVTGRGQGKYRHPTGRGRKRPGQYRHPTGSGRMRQGDIGTLLDVSFQKGCEHFPKCHNLEMERVENQSRICIDAPDRVPSTHQVTRPQLVYSESREPAKSRASLKGSKSTFFPRHT